MSKKSLKIEKFSGISAKFSGRRSLLDPNASALRQPDESEEAIKLLVLTDPG